MDTAWANKPAPGKKGVTHAQRWQQLDSKKLPMMRRCEDYAMWTLPYVFPQVGIKEGDLQGPVDSTGSRAVNHLANKLIMTLFQPHNPFFRLNVSTAITAELATAAEEGDEDAA